MSIAGAPPFGIRLVLQVVDGKRRKVAEWDEDALRVVAKVVKARAAGLGSREIARRHLIGVEKRRGAGVIATADGYTDRVIRRICTEHRTFYETGVLEVILTINGTLVPTRLTLPDPSQFDFMPSASEFASAQRNTEANRRKAPTRSVSPVVGLFDYQDSDGVGHPLRSYFAGNDGVRHLCAPKGHYKVSVRADELEASVKEQVASALMSIASDELHELCEPSAGDTAVDSNWIESEVGRLKGRLKRILQEKTETDHQASLAQLSQIQREVEEQLTELQHLRESELARAPEAALTQEEAMDLHIVLAEGADRDVRALMHALLDEAVIDEDGVWSARLYWSKDSELFSHVITGQVPNRAKRRVRDKKPLEMWMRGLNVDEIRVQLAHGGRDIERETLVNHYLRPSLGGTLATCTSNIVQTIAIGIFTKDPELEHRFGAEWATRIRTLYFNDDSTVRNPSDFGNWCYAVASRLRDQVVAVLMEREEEISLDDLASVLDKDPHNLRTQLRRWPKQLTTTSVKLDTESGMVRLLACPQCGARTPTELACPEPVGAVCASCGMDPAGLKFDGSFMGAFLRGYPLGPNL